MDTLYPGANEPFRWPVELTDEEDNPVVLTEIGLAFGDGDDPPDPDDYQTVTVTDGHVEVRLAHPTAPGGGAIVQTLGTHRPWFRASNGSSTVVREGPYFYVV